MTFTTASFRDEYADEISCWPISAAETADWAGNSAPFPMSPEQLLRWRADPDVHAYVGYLNGGLVAYGELWVDEPEDEIELARIIVKPAHRQHGIGRAFVETLVSRAVTYGLSNMVMRVVSDNLTAIRCYETSGFERVPPDEEKTFNRGQRQEYVWLRYAARPQNFNTNVNEESR